MSTWTQEQINEVLGKIMRLSATDAEFRKLCLENPNEAISKVAGMEVPDGVVIKFVENAGAHMTIVLPDMADEELSEGDLDSVAGGTNQNGGNKYEPGGTGGGSGGYPVKAIGF